MSKTTDPSFGDITLLDLDHPGANDPEYRARRDTIGRLAKESRESGTLPRIEYTEQEHQTWKTITNKLLPLQQKHACSMYLQARKRLDISNERIPQLADLSERLKAIEGFTLGAVEGLIDARNFLSQLADRRMLCTQYIRHHSKPEYTPEPDIVHEVIGHVPTFVDKDFVEFSERVGRAAQVANDEELVQLERLYWFTLEFGLIQEQDEVKIYGAGLLSSFGEIQHCLTDAVDRKPFSIEDIMKHDYEYSHMQDVLYIVPSFAALKKSTENFLANMG